MQRSTWKEGKCGITRHGLVVVSVILCSGVSPILSRGGALDSFKTILGNAMNSVAHQVADLPEPNRDWGVRGLDFSANGELLAVDGDPDKIRVWDWRNTRLVATLTKPAGSNDLSIVNPIRYSPDGRFLANCGKSGEGDIAVRVWNAGDWSVSADITGLSGTPVRGSCTDVAFTPDGQYLVRTADTFPKNGNNLVAYSTKTWEPVWGVPLDGVATKFVSISPDGKWAAVAGRVTIFPVGVTDRIEAIHQLKYESAIYFVDLKLHQMTRKVVTNVVGPMQWSRDGSRILEIDGNGIEMLDVQSGEALLREPLDGAAHTNLRLTADDAHWIESDMNGLGTGLGVKIWDGYRKKLLQHIAGNVYGIAVSRDGRQFAIGTASGVSVWQFN